MTITEAKNCKGKRGYIEGTPFPTLPSMTGEVMCHGYTDYDAINHITGKLTRVIEVAISKKHDNGLYGSALVDRKLVKLLPKELA